MKKDTVTVSIDGEKLRAIKRYMGKKDADMELRTMSGREGLILQGCGGDLTEWVDGINELFTDESILQNGDTFNTAILECCETNE